MYLIWYGDNTVYVLYDCVCAVRTHRVCVPLSPAVTRYPFKNVQVLKMVKNITSVNHIRKYMSDLPAVTLCNVQG